MESVPTGSAGHLANDAPVKADLFERIDEALRTMMESYAGIIEGTKATSSTTVAVGGHSLLVSSAAMTRASEDLMRIAGEVGCGLALAESQDAAAQAARLE
eukprot:TRINITY_DN6972_c0_g1_i3.p1 TRINITY_DN6972_c0_g1~~TRINITY_DN6972_c0_g1_i3.p1  ORF type:complete len:101 (-),score=28.11 TRINITY_DN6972_c0_g1_i3:156-458(-)